MATMGCILENKIVLSSGQRMNNLLMFKETDLYCVGYDGEKNIIQNYNTPLSFDIFLEEEAFSNISLLFFPTIKAISREFKIKINLIGNNASCKISALYLCCNNEKLNFDIEIKHLHPKTTSMQLFNGVLSGTSYSSFNSLIYVAPTAQKVEAYQENHNIILSQTAKVETSPQLEIYADDVKCSHGATLGQFDEEGQFYMRSRGISKSQAQILQILSFAEPVLTTISNERLKEEICNEIEKAANLF